MSTDRELLELAAKAAGIEIVNCTCGDEKWPFKYALGGTRRGHWNPLSDDGDALRLAVKLHIGNDCFVDAALVEYCCAWVNHRNIARFHRAYEKYGDDPLLATRRAIVRAAAAIGESMP